MSREGFTYAAWCERTELSCCDANEGSCDDEVLHCDSWVRICCPGVLVELSMLAYKVHLGNSGQRFNCEGGKLKLGEGTESEGYQGKGKLERRGWNIWQATGVAATHTQIQVTIWAQSGKDELRSSQFPCRHHQPTARGKVPLREQKATLLTACIRSSSLSKLGWEIKSAWLRYLTPNLHDVVRPRIYEGLTPTRINSWLSRHTTRSLIDQASRSLPLSLPDLCLGNHLK
jgi:hypothetical protein